MRPGAAATEPARSPRGAAPSGWRARFPGFGLRLTRWGGIFLAVLLVLGLAAVNTGNNALIMVLGLALGSYVVSGAWSRQVLGGVTVRLERPRELFAGRPVVLGLTVTNHSRLPAYGLVLRDGRGRAVLLESLLPGRSECRRSIEIVLPRRGWTVLGPWRVEVLLPLGFFLKSKRVVGEERVLVYPRLLPTARARRVGASAGREAARERDHGREGDVTQLRGFQSGDERRQIHWKQTARQQRLIVTERQRRSEGAVYLVLDPRVDHLDDAAALERFEAAVSSVATVAVERIRRREPVGLILGRTVVAPVAGPEHGAALLAPLAEVRAEPADAPPPQVPKGIDWTVFSPGEAA